MPGRPTTRGGCAAGVVAGRAAGELDPGGRRLEARGQQVRADQARLLPDVEFFEIEARFPEFIEEFPQPAVQYVAGLVKVPAAELAKYDLAGAKRHRKQIREVLRNTGRPHNPATVVREVDAVARFAPTEHDFAVTTAARRKVFGLATADVRPARPLARQSGSQCSSCARVLATARMRRCSGDCSRGRTRWIVRLGAPRSGRQVRPAGDAVTAASPAGARVTPSRKSRWDMSKEIAGV